MSRGSDFIIQQVGLTTKPTNCRWRIQNFFFSLIGQSIKAWWLLSKFPYLVGKC